MSNTSTVAIAYAENNGNTYTTNLSANQHKVIADEPTTLGGKDEGPSPGDYLCMSLASCKAITLRMYVQRKKWEINTITVRVALEKKEAEDGVVHVFHAEVLVDESIPVEQKERLVFIAKSCPISKLLGKQNFVETKVVTVFSN